MSGKCFFSADSHFGHSSIIRLDSRPFQTIEEHDDALIRNWNEVVDKDDVVWFLGDFCYKAKNPVKWYLERLNGKIHLVKGNHDDGGAWKHKGLFASAQEAAYITHEDQKIYMLHYSCRTWRASNHGSWHLFGHSHGKLNHLGAALGLSMDVGTNVNGYRPVSFEEIKAIMDSRRPPVADLPVDSR